MSFKKYLYKKVIAAATALTMVFTVTGCGESTSWIAKYNDLTVNSGIYIFYQTQAFSEATSLLKKDNEDLDVSDTKLLKTMMVENTDITQWINNKATENMRIFMAVNYKFDELGLELTEEEKQEISQMVEMYWQYYSASYEMNGIGKDSFKQMMELDYKKRKLFFHYYDIGGEYEYSDNEIMSYLEGNYARTKVVKLYLTDGNDEELDADGKKEIKAMAEDYRKRAMAGEDLLDLSDEYTAYRDKLVEEARAEAEKEENAEDDDETVTDDTEKDETSADETVSEDTENEESSEEETEDAASDDTSEDETEGSDEENSEDEEESEETEEGSDEESEEEGAGEEDSDDEEGTDEDSDKEKSDEEDSEDETAEDDEKKEREPFEGETIYRKGSEEDGYTPSETVNKAIFDKCFVNGDPVVIEDEENLSIYVVQRLDILERTDLFEGEARQSLLLEILEDEFKAKNLEWMPEDAIKKNERAYRRYDPFKIKF